MKKQFNIFGKGLLSVVFAAILGGTLGFSPLGALALAAGFFASSLYMPKHALGTFNFASLAWADGEDNMGGIRTTAYYIPASQVTTEPSLVNSELDGDYTLEAGKYFLSFYTTAEVGDVVDEGQGETDGRSFKHKGKLFFPGTKEAALDFCRAANNTGFIFIFVESTGQRRVVGSKAFPAKLSIGTTTGAKTADRKGISIEVESYGYSPAPYFKGIIALSGETIPAIS
jgi:hypothetical protein